MHYKKSLGQHFLHDKDIIEKIIEAVIATNPKNLVEVGPGAGAITKDLINIPNTIFKAIELDREKVALLKTNFPSIKNEIYEADFLNIKSPFDDNFSVVGNFPYNISTQIIFKILEWQPQVDVIIGMFQKEVAQRIVSKHGSKVYGIMSVMTQAYYDAEYLFDVTPNCFTPPPNVMSGVIKLTLRKDIPEFDYAKLLKICKASFGQRRKTLRNSLSSIIPKEQLTSDFYNLRAEQLTVQQIIDMSNSLL